MREEFENLPEIARRIAEANSLNYDEKLNAWTSPEWDSTTCCNQDFVNAAWYAFQEQQKKIDKISDSFDSFLSECELWGFDSDQANRQLEIIQELLK